MAANLRIHLLSGLVVLGTFIAGAVAGAGLYRWLQPRQALPAPIFPLCHDLSLSPEQARQAERIVTNHRPELERIMHDSFEQVRGVQERMNAEVRAILTPEQRQKFEELCPPPGPPGMHLVPGARPPAGLAPLSPPPGMAPLPPSQQSGPSSPLQSMPTPPGARTDAGE